MRTQRRTQPTAEIISFSQTINEIYGLVIVAQAFLTLFVSSFSDCSVFRDFATIQKSVPTEAHFPRAAEALRSASRRPRSWKMANTLEILQLSSGSSFPAPPAPLSFSFRRKYIFISVSVTDGDLRSAGPGDGEPAKEKERTDRKKHRLLGVRRSRGARGQRPERSAEERRKKS